MPSSGQVQAYAAYIYAHVGALYAVAVLLQCWHSYNKLMWLRCQGDGRRCQKGGDGNIFGGRMLGVRFLGLLAWVSLASGSAQAVWLCPGKGAVPALTARALADQFLRTSRE